MRILARYVLKEIVSHSLIGLLVFTFVIYIPHISRLLEVVARRNLPITTVTVLFLAPVPAILVLTIPMAILVGILLGLSRLAADGEVIAARAVGIGTSSFARPAITYACAGWLLASAMSLYLAPRSNLELIRREAEVRNSQAAYEIQPRVFIEQFPRLLMYVQDVTRDRWHHVFIADTSRPGSPKVTLAESGTLVNDARSGSLVLHLEHGATHQVDGQNPSRYSVASFTETDIPLPPANAESVTRRLSPAMQSLPLLIWTARHSSDVQERRAAQVEFQNRLALPMASLVLALVGVPLGVFTRKGGKAVGVMVTILLAFIYYILMASGQSLARQGRVPPIVGLWVANVVFAVTGILMLAHLRRARLGLQRLQDWLVDVGRSLHRWRHKSGGPLTLVAAAPVRPPGSRIFQILDVYVMRSWLFYLVLLLLTFAGIYIVFDFFQLLGDIVKNHARPGLVFDYYRYLFPYVVYLMLPLSVLMATLVNFSLLTKSSQITAIKAIGVSLYRISLPVLALGALLSAGMFALGDQYLPETNQMQSAYRNEIKGRPAQTYFRPDVQWIFGHSDRVYNYRFFDPDHNVFANLSAFEFDPATFTMRRRIYAQRAFWEPHIPGWVLEDGWVRDLDGDRVTAFRTFSVATFKELDEPPEYFKKEVKTSEQMSAGELRGYIRELRQSGFDVVPLSVQLDRKFSYPLVAFVVGLIGIPFSFTAGRKGALTGIALSIGIAIVYWSVSSLFEAMGNLGQLPPAVAAWSPDVLFAVGGLYALLRVRT
ncbi:MAG TPA: LPS export ABC transporter permease LptF [Terriglobia bacterium]|nr:LPS export ABC transporter permease LptF [Terriglobia bacterium]